jgi:hypothetical protein
MTLPLPGLATVLAFLTVVAVGSCDFCDAGTRALSPASGAAPQLAAGAPVTR